MLAPSDLDFKSGGSLSSVAMNRKLQVILSIGIGLLLIAIWLHIVDIGEVVQLFKEMKLYIMLPAGALFFSAYFMRSLRWKAVLSPVERISVAESFYLCMINYLINYFIPVHGGEVAKSVLLKRIKGTPVSGSLLTVYVDKAMDLLPILMLLPVAPFLTPRLSRIAYMALGVGLVLIFSVVSFLLFLLLKKNSAVKFLEGALFWVPGRFKVPLLNFLRSLVDSVCFIRHLPGRLPGIAGLTILALLLNCACLWTFFYAFGAKMPFSTILVGYILLNVSFILPAPPGFMGSLELMFVFIFAYLYGYEKNLVSAVAASSHIFSAAFFGILGFVSLTLVGTKGEVSS